MRFARTALFLSAVGVAAAASVLSWRAQLETNRKLDAIAAALVAKPAEPALESRQPPAVMVPAAGSVPRELEKATLPPYVIEAPDTLTIEAVIRDPKTGTTDRLPGQPVSGPFIVRPDGTVGLGLWGSVYVSGLTCEKAAEEIRKKIVVYKPTESAAENVAVVVDVLAYNSKFCYLITDAADGEQVLRLPLTGSVTVLDAVANAGGVANVAAKRKMWVARRTQQAGQPWQTLPVDWAAITQRGETATNYQLLPGDRVYVARAD